jgi:hypothetical protein
MLTVHADVWLLPCYPADYRLSAWQMCRIATPSTMISMWDVISPSGGMLLSDGVCASS